MSQVAREAGVARKSLYNATSIAGNPTLETLQSVLEALDLKLEVVPNVGGDVSNTLNSSSKTNTGITIELDVATPNFSGITKDVANAGGSIFYRDTLQVSAAASSSYRGIGGLADLLNAPVKSQAFQGQAGELGPMIKFLAEKEESESRNAVKI
jgi:hypothetical protein